MPCLYVTKHCCWHKPVDCRPLMKQLPDAGGADIVNGRPEQVDALGKRRHIKRIAWPGIDQQPVMSTNVAGTHPAVEMQPIVSPDDERKGRCGICRTQRFKRPPGIRRPWQAEFEIGRTDAGHFIGSEACHGKSLGLRQQRGLCFKRIARRNHQPHLVCPAVADYPLRQANVPPMDRIERPAEDANPPHRPRNSRTQAVTSATAAVRSSLTTTTSNFGAKLNS